ncbi:MAG: Ku protein [Lautropia sp.]
MPRAIWNGVISFGLLNIPVALHAGERTTDLHFRMLDSRDHARIRFERVNADTGEEVPWQQIVKAYEYQKGNYVVLDDKDFERAAPESHEAVEIESFVARDALNPMYFEKPYYLVPGKRADKGYVLLREVLRRSDRIAIARVVIRTREHLSAVMPLADALVLLLLRFPQELVKPDVYSLPGQRLADYRIAAKEIAAAEQLVESMTVEFDPDQYVDDFRKRLHAAIDRRIAADETVQPPDDEDEEPARHGGNVVDFVALLRKSLAGKAGEAPGTRPKRGARAHSSTAARRSAKTAVATKATNATNATEATKATKATEASKANKATRTARATEPNERSSGTRTSSAAARQGGPRRRSTVRRAA